MSKRAHTITSARKDATRRRSDPKREDEIRIQGQAFELPVRQEKPDVAPALASAQEYRFLQLNEGDFKPRDAASRKLIRSHVMRNHFQDKKTQSEDLSHAISASTVISKDKLKGRWRLVKQSVSEGRKQVTAVGEPQPDPPPQRSPSITAAAASGHVQQPAIHNNQASQHEQMPPLLYGVAAFTVPRLETFQTSVRDPFDSMPVAASNPRTNRLMHFYQTEFNINRLAQNPTNTFYDYVVGHEGLLHGMLAIVALYMHGHRGLPVKADILFHRGQAMQVIQRNLLNSEKMDQSAVLGTMISITVFENLCGNYFTAKAHLKALRSLISSAGGIACFTENDSIPRAVAWAEYHYAAATRSLPGFRYSAAECGHPNPPIPERLLFNAAKDYPYSLALIETHGHNVYSIFRRLHIMSIATTSEWDVAREIDLDFRYALSNVMLDTEYDMVVFAHELKSVIPIATTQTLALADVCDCLCVAAQIFFYAGLRVMPLGTRTVDVFISRLKRALYNGTLIDSWRIHAPLESLLWTLVVTATAAVGRAEYLPAMAKLRELCGRIGLRDMDGLVRNLRVFAWNDTFDALGGDILRGLFRIPSLTFSGVEDRDVNAPLLLLPSTNAGVMYKDLPG